MRIAVRLFGLLLLLGALAAAAWQFQLWAQTGRFVPLALGQMWFTLDPPSLNLVQAVIERYVWPHLWDPVLLTVLRWPAWAVLGLPALILLILPMGRRRRKDGWNP
ncbi:MAG TPA: hypothetical protein VED46_06045 [Alphaproteobacteria bacterium]|jgi:hypothetical protein|nr:hypothetical protein [Alphaproteobacteria bacterium]